MIIVHELLQARLDAIALMLDEDVKEVKIFFDEKEKVWCVDHEVFTEEELEKSGLA